MLESFLAVITLAKIEGKLVLGGPNFTKDVVVSLPFKKSVAHTRMAVIRSIVQRGPLTVVLCIDVCTALQE